MPSPADVRVALQRVAAAIHSLLNGTADPLVHEVTTRDLHRFRRALKDAGLFKTTGSGRGGGGGSLLNQSATSQETSTTAQEPETEAPGSRSRTTWLTPYYDAYRAAYGEPPTAVTVRRMARTFQRLEVDAPRAEVVRRFVQYVSATPARFYSAERFADSWPEWADVVAVGPGGQLTAAGRQIVHPFRRA